ncbi:uncharacterized protein BJ212DRAFT_1330078 [Suillus subaureus]|uniref:Uncharacterized protein n=1 Tax=Suillus subaureus TaxID=48587 RepID=A0A9P7EJ73_9AGAM|nr:uncharacterized protein BJ212DRAFT_1330078 [Suillus subaureus]KAG1822707.1 hypothetical protein BJ212DRAFT_1330078 [Suillus subaureus]
MEYALLDLSGATPSRRRMYFTHFGLLGHSLRGVTLLSTCRRVCMRGLESVVANRRCENRSLNVDHSGDIVRSPCPWGRFEAHGGSKLGMFFSARDSTELTHPTARTGHAHLRMTSSYFGIARRDAEENQESSATVHLMSLIFSLPHLPLALGLALLSCHWILPCRIPLGSSLFPVLMICAACTTRRFSWFAMIFATCHDSQSE